ncbi:MAG: zinc ribbon domain-containing protein [Ilumatobacteraceae bacterium]
MNAHALLALQDIDTSLTAIANKAARVAERAEVAAARDALARHRAAMATAEADIAAAGERIDAADSQSGVIATKRSRLEGQLKTVIAPREAEALMHEIEGLDAQRAVLDDEELEAMEAQALAEGVLAGLTADLPVVEGVLAAAEAALAAVLATFEAEAAELTVRRSEAAAALDATELSTYERARAQFDGVGIARLVGHRCEGCHLDLTPAEIDAVKATPEGTLAECPQCSRYLVR